MSPRAPCLPGHLCGVPCCSLFPGPGTQKGAAMPMWPQRPDVPGDSPKATQECRAEQGLDASPAFPPCPCLPRGDLLIQWGVWGGHGGKPLLPNTPICTPGITGFLRPPACQPAMAPTLCPPPLGWLFSWTHSFSALLCSEEPRSLSQSPFCLGEAGKGEGELGLEGGVSKSAPAWLLIRVGSACMWTEA